MNTFKIRRTLFFAPPGKSSGDNTQHKPRISSAGTKDVLTGPDIVPKKKKRRKRNGKKTRFKEFRMCPESDTFFNIARSVGGNHTTLSQFVADELKLFRQVNTCSIYLADKIGGDDNEPERTILRHRLTLERMEDGSFRTRNMDPQQNITRKVQNELVDFDMRKPIVYNFKKGFKLIFRTLTRGNRRYDPEPIARRPGKDEMVVHIPIVYRNKPIGLLVIGGNLGIAIEEKGPLIMAQIKEETEKLSSQGNQAIDNLKSLIRKLQETNPELIDDPREIDERRAARACAMGIDIGTVVGEKLFTKYGGVTELNGMKDFRMDLEDYLKKIKDKKISSLYVFMIDLDYFKATNDTFGHLKGDEVLRMVADILKECVRAKKKGSDQSGNKGGPDKQEDAKKPKKLAFADRRSHKDDESDNTEPDNVFRWGGEEFMILLPDVDPKEALLRAHMIMKKISQIRILLDSENDFVKVDGEWVPASPGQVITSTCSIGAVDIDAVLPQKNRWGIKRRAAEIIERVDKLLYKAKNERNMIIFAHMVDGKLKIEPYRNGDSKQG